MFKNWKFFFLLLRTWQEDPSSGPLYLSSVSTEHPEVLVEGVRAQVHSCLYLLEPTGARKTRLTHLCRTDTRWGGRGIHVFIILRTGPAERREAETVSLKWQDGPLSWDRRKSKGRVSCRKHREAERIYGREKPIKRNMWRARWDHLICLNWARSVFLTSDQHLSAALSQSPCRWARESRGGGETALFSHDSCPLKISSCRFSAACMINLTVGRALQLHLSALIKWNKPQCDRKQVARAEAAAAAGLTEEQGPYKLCHYPAAPWVGRFGQFSYEHAQCFLKTQ